MSSKVTVSFMALSIAFGGAVGAAASEEQALVRGRQAANTLVDTLRDQVNSNIGEKGAAGALPQCYYQELTVRKEIETTTGVRVKRTSSKIRNPRNAPDGYEREALARFERFAKEGSMPSEEIRPDTVDGKAVFRYVKPITVGAGCLQCHGEAASLSDDVRRTLDEKYADDKAVGYKEGDFRGLFSAVIPAD